MGIMAYSLLWVISRIYIIGRIWVQGPYGLGSRLSFPVASKTPRGVFVFLGSKKLRTSTAVKPYLRL